MIIDTKKLDALLANKCMSLKELANTSGVDTGTLSRLRSGSRAARPQTIGKIARALKVDAELIVK